MRTADDLERDRAAQELLTYLRAEPSGADRFVAAGPDWFGDRVFGGVVLAQALSAAVQTADIPAHSLHAAFLRPQRPGDPVELTVDRVRDGRTFRTRQVVMTQDGKELAHATVSFHAGDPGDEYQLPMPDVPPPEELAPEDHDWGPEPLDQRDIGPVPNTDGTYRSTRLVWERSGHIGDDPGDHLLVAAYLSDMTGSGFRPRSLGTWGDHADASLDHALWFHRPIRTDEWLLFDLHAVVNAAGRSTCRGTFYARDGALVMSMAQELLIRPL